MRLIEEIAGPSAYQIGTESLNRRMTDPSKLVDKSKLQLRNEGSQERLFQEGLVEAEKRIVNQLK